METDGINNLNYKLIKIIRYSDYTHIFVDLKSSSDLKIQNVGQNCWIECKNTQGPCTWCGTNGFCCRKDWKGNGCDGLFGGKSSHVCVLKPG